MATKILFLHIFFWTVALNNAHFNLFINQQEVRKLLGLSNSDLYYVRDGVVNTYAMNFEVLVPANVSVLEFFWTSLIRYPVPYSWSIEYNNRLAMRRPSFNIPLHGQLPTTVTPFQVKLQCTGNVSAEVRIMMHLNVSSASHRQNNTLLTFRRNKLCRKKTEQSLKVTERSEIVSEEPTVSKPNVTESDTTPVTTKEELFAKNNTTSGPITANDDSNSDTILYLLLGLLCIVIAVIFLIVFSSPTLHSYLRLVPSQSNRMSCPNTPYAPTPNMFVRLESARYGSYATITSIRKDHTFVTPYATSYIAQGNTMQTVTTASEQDGSTDNNDDLYEDHIYSKPDTSSKISYYASSDLASTLDKGALKDPRQYEQHEIQERLSLLYVPKNLVVIQRPIMEGAFSKVYKGFIRHPCAVDKMQPVLIKSVNEEASDSQIRTMLQEGLMLYELKHVNILSVMAINCEPGLSPLLIYPLPSKGNLKKYLQSYRTREGSQFTLMTRDIINIAIQVAIAGVFLHTNGFCHKDLATRNCTIEDDYRIKVGDSALSRDLFPQDYHCLADGENRPIKWLALESLAQRQYSAASDVWSFGVLLWELMTLARQPYEDLDPYEMQAYLRDGYRLAQPVNCPDDIFGMMNCCWLANPKERPTFVHLLACLQDFQTALNRFI